MRRATDFISDLHLTAARPATVQRFLRYLAECPGRLERLYILGDLFEAYIGDDDESWPHGAVKQALRRLNEAGTAIFFQAGNRDFLAGMRFAEQTGATLFGDYAVIELYGTPTLLTHGDLLCTDDRQYQAARIRVRSPEWRRAALAKPLWLRRLYARWYRYRSGRDQRSKNREIMDVNQAAVDEALRRHGVRRLIHGHTHRPGVHRFELDAAPAWRFVLPEWDGQEWILRWEADGYRQIPVGG